MLFTATIFFAPKSFAECPDSAADNVVDCIKGESSITGDLNYCLSQFSGGGICSLGQVFEKLAQEYFVDTIEEKCCAKGKAKKIIACLKANRSKAKPVRRVVGKDFNSGVNQELAETISEVKHFKKCLSEQ
ncbi:MAG: hypothetical protein D6780_07635 [Candidatus Dadabacteria bacterium]|nr:MAG: hypothetical protein D6780_07635 [Candidatus Dadabacteria bacterium]